MIFRKVFSVIKGKKRKKLTVRVFSLSLYHSSSKRCLEEFFFLAGKYSSVNIDHKQLVWLNSSTIDGHLGFPVWDY